MKPKNSYNKSIREKLEERVKFFLDLQNSKINTNNIKRIMPNNKSHSTTLKDSLINTFKDKQITEKARINNNIVPLHGMNENISSLSTQLQVANDINANHPSYKIENQKIPIKKEIIKYMEPKFKLVNFTKLSPKFNKDIETNSSNIMPQKPLHEITESEIEMLEIDEKLPIKNFEELETNKMKNIIYQKSIPSPLIRP